MNDFHGLFHVRPYLGGVLAAMLFSLAGIPLTAGFLGKVYIAAAAVGSACWLLATVLVVTSTIGLFHYLRIIAAVLARKTGHAAGGVRRSPRCSAVGGAVLALLTVMLLWLGVLPSPLIRRLQSSIDEPPAVGVQDLPGHASRISGGQEKAAFLWRNNAHDNRCTNHRGPTGAPSAVTKASQRPRGSSR